MWVGDVGEEGVLVERGEAREVVLHCIEREQRFGLLLPDESNTKGVRDTRCDGAEVAAGEQGRVKRDEGQNKRTSTSPKMLASQRALAGAVATPRAETRYRSGLSCWSKPRWSVPSVGDMPREILPHRISKPRPNAQLEREGYMRVRWRRTHCARRRPSGRSL